MATLLERIAELEESSAVVLVETPGTPEVVNGTDIRMLDVAFWYTLGNVMDRAIVRIYILDYSTQDEAAYWHRKEPAVLRVPGPIDYFSARTASTITAAQIEAYCNAEWQALKPGAADILRFEVTPIDGATVEIAGIFHDPTSNTWSHKRYYIRLLDPDGAVSPGNANVKFEALG